MAYAKQALENYNFFGAPHVAIIHTDEPLGIYGAVDCGAYVGNFMLAAQALGLGTIPQAALARHSGLIRRHFKLADDRKVVCGISFGYRRPRPQGEQLPHLAGERRRYRDVRGLAHVAAVEHRTFRTKPAGRGLDPGIHRLQSRLPSFRWIAGSSPTRSGTGARQ